MEFICDDIVKLTKEGMLLTNAEKTFYVNFEECNENWLKYQRFNNLKTSYFKIVGQRSMDSTPVFMEFFTNPRTRILYLPSPKCELPKEKYREIRTVIMEYGWTLLDLG